MGTSAMERSTGIIEPTDEELDLEQELDEGDASAPLQRAAHPVVPAAAEPSSYQHTAWLILLSFIVTFIITRAVVILIMTHQLPSWLYLNVRGTHIHHISYGIVMMAFVGAYALITRPKGIAHRITCVLYGIALALVCDEFGLIIYPRKPYWQRASLDAVAGIAAIFTLIAWLPRLRRPARHWLVQTALVGLATAFLIGMVIAVHYASAVIVQEFFEHVEMHSPA